MSKYYIETQARDFEIEADGYTLPDPGGFITFFNRKAGTTYVVAAFPADGLIAILLKREGK